MSIPALSRRTLMASSAATLAALGMPRGARLAFAAQTPVDGTVIPWTDRLAENPVPNVIVQQLDWETLDSWITPNDEFFIIKHYDEPTIDLSTWALQVSGLVSTPLSLSLADLQARERAEVTFTIECSGNTGLPFFDGGIGNAVWAGTPLASILEDAGVLENGSEVVFWGADAGDQVRGEVTITEHFARSMSIEEAMNPENLIVWEMNGEPLPPLHGAPARLIAPGWYGVANVKWLTRIDITNQRHAGNFMARDYVTIRQVMHDDEQVWTLNTVAHDRLKSAPARVIENAGSYAVQGAAWGEAIAGVDVSVDGADWQPAELTTGADDPYTWTFWTYDLGALPAGEHSVASRATSVSGDEQPAPDDPFLAGKTTYWESNGIITRTILVS
ncbi:MAG TPA: molybdopterin-dependent oxidoreductase [Thermomicrobiales bacterium]|nr:molybdopterin-dependent oxidoreductase [Thermomicrobiales bacterium]